MVEWRDILREHFTDKDNPKNNVISINHFKEIKKIEKEIRRIEKAAQFPPELVKKFLAEVREITEKKS